MYTVNGQKFESFFAAVAFAKANDLEVFQADNGARRWSPAPKKAPKTRHVLINADGTQPPQFLRDGRYLWKTEKSGFAHLAVGDIAGGAPTPITSGNWMVDQVIGLDESKRIVYFTGTKDDVRRRRAFGLHHFTPFREVKLL